MLTDIGYGIVTSFGFFTMDTCEQPRALSGISFQKIEIIKQKVSILQILALFFCRYRLLNQNSEPHN